MKSKINPNKISYSESKKLDDGDLGFDSTLYDFELFGVPVQIALGKESYAFSKYDVVFYSIYLIIESEPKSRIGVFEVDSNQVINIIDEDGDIELSKFKDNILIFISEEYLRRILKEAENSNNENTELSDIEKGKSLNRNATEIPESEEISNEPIYDDETNVMRLNLPDNKISKSIKDSNEILSNQSQTDGIFVINNSINPPTMLSEEKLEIADEIKREYKESSKHNWMKKFMKNDNYSIIDNEGGGDCFFAVIRDAFKQIGKETTVEKLRALLSKEATDDMFREYRTLYINFLAELQEKEKELKDIKKTVQILKKRSQTNIDKYENEQIISQAKELLEKHKEISFEKKEAKSLLNEFEYMRNIDSLEKFKEYIMTRDYWADTWAISTLEKLLNIKMIIFSEESYKAKDYDSVLNCGQLNDNDLENQGNFKPDYYIITCYTGNHYKLISYKEKNILVFREIPYDIKIMIINKCMERNAGPYYLIQDFRKLKTDLGLNPNEGQPQDDDDYITKDLYEKDIVFMFYSNSNAEPKAGKGSGEKIDDKRLLEFNTLNNIMDWRKKLDDSWITPFMVDNNRWNSVEHYYLGSQFKKGFPDFYLHFSLDSGSDISKDLATARIAGSKTGKTKDKVLRESKIKIDPDFFEVGVNSRHQEERRKALHAKFTQNMDLGKMLRETKMAKLLHFIRGHEPETDDMIMKIRKEMK
jgi:hypothetical protein